MRHENDRQTWGKKETESGIEAAVRHYACRKQAVDPPVLSAGDWDECIDNATMQIPENGSWRGAWMFVFSRAAPYVVSSIIGGLITGLVLLQMASPSQPAVTNPGYAAQSDNHIAKPAHFRPHHPLIPEDKRTYVRAGDCVRYVIEPGTRARFHTRTDSSQILLASSGTLVWQTDTSAAGDHAIVTPHGILETGGALVWMEINEFETQIQVLQGLVRVTAKKQRSARQFHSGTLVVIGAGDVNTTDMEPAFTGDRSELYKRYLRWLDSAQKSVS
ncbi:MAG: hypothetical protein ACOC41_08050 [Chitinivibrionales bacterium]